MPKVRKIGRPADWDDHTDANNDDEYDDNDERSAYGYGDWGWYPPSSPIRTDKGIKARSQRGAFGESWWAKRWIAALDRFGWGSRLQRGRTYARQGQVLSIEFAGAKIKARVQGSRPKPYDVTIEMQPLAAAQWEQAIDALAQQAIFAAQLLAGEMPQDIESAFDAAGVPLFPRGPKDIAASCSCPDYANPCKHIAAVYYLLGERFDEDPFLIFQARGRTREQIVEALRARRAGASEKAEVFEMPAPEPLPALADLLGSFYQAGPELDAIEAHIAAPEIDSALLKRYGPAPADTDADLRVIYRALTARALERVLGEDEP
ncbi:MAG TPA: SWIM zinc finger family protein [Roseiflexaceae bacterium]|nr:SWIM zinc finger family protein [Roseiflexaceae bacterium]